MQEQQSRGGPQFREEFTTEQRKELYSTYIQKSSMNSCRKIDNYVCVVFEPSPKLKRVLQSKNSLQRSGEIEQGKRRARKPYRVVVTHKDCKVGHLLKEIHNYWKLDTSQSFFLFCEGRLLNVEWELTPIYDTCHDRADGFLYLGVNTMEWMG